MRILTYKRTHTGDPDHSGIFGISDCMGSIRNRYFDAVVGIGSKQPWRGDEAIAGKVTWVGVGPYRARSPGDRGDRITFEKFIILDGDGPDFETEAPNLAKRFYVRNARSISHSYSLIEKQELEALILKMINDPRCMHHEQDSADDKLAARRKKCRNLTSPAASPCY